MAKFIVAFKIVALKIFFGTLEVIFSENLKYLRRRRRSSTSDSILNADFMWRKAYKRLYKKNLILKLSRYK